MCGIAGLQGNFEKKDIINATKRISHRGPDHFGTEIIF